MKKTTKINLPTNCHHHWKAIPVIGIRKYICTECSMFGFRHKDGPQIHEHSIEVSDDLLDQYIELGQLTVSYVAPEKRSGPKPGIVKMRADNDCAHDWIPAPEYSDESHPRLKCTKCERVGRKWASTGEILPFVEEYAASLRRYQIRKQHLEGEPTCEHEWELLPLLGTKFVNRYECKKCRWLGYRTGIKVPIKVHTALSTARIRSENGLRKEPDDKEREQKEGLVAEGVQAKAECQDQKEVHIPAAEDSTDTRSVIGREDSMGKQPNMRSQV